MSTNWAHLIADLQREHDISERQLSAKAEVNRSTLRRFFQGKTTLNVHKVERILTLFGYELDAVKVSEPLFDQPEPPQPVAKSRRAKRDDAPQRRLISIKPMVTEKVRPKRLIIIRKRVG